LKLLLDTTYLLPAIGISVKGLLKDAPIRLMQKGHQIFISNVSIFELSAKGAKYVSAGRLAAERVARGIRAINYDEKIEMVLMHESALLLIAFKLRGMLTDFIDCVILASAINQCDALITEDNDIQDLRKNKEFRDFLTTINPKFEIKTLDEALQTDF